MGSTSLQEAVDCFEAVRARGHAENPEGLATICERLAVASDEPWIRDRQPASVDDAEGNYWEPAADYWHYALGWVEAQLRPSEIRELLETRENQAAERRLRTYFFGGWPMGCPSGACQKQPDQC